MGCSGSSTETTSGSAGGTDESGEDDDSYDERMRRKKVLLLGTGESGKTTLTTQLRTLYGQAMTEPEKMLLKPLVVEKVFDSCRIIIKESIRISGVEKDESCRVTDTLEKQVLTELLGESEAIDPSMAGNASSGGDSLSATATAGGGLSGVGDSSVRSALTTTGLKSTDIGIALSLWNDPGIRVLFSKYRHSIQRWIDGTEYFFQSEVLQRYSVDEYAATVPTHEEILHLRKRTTGLNKITLDTSKTATVDPSNSGFWEFFDMGGQMSERHKWAHFFDHVNTLVYVFSATDYSQSLWEDALTNRFTDTLDTFDKLVRNEFFNDCKVLIVVNKIDLLDERLKLLPVGEVFPEFNDFRAERMGDSEEINEHDIAIDWFISQFSSKTGDKTVGRVEVCAYDEALVENMFRTLVSL